MSKSELYIEKRENGDYAIRRPGSERASAICKSVPVAIKRARSMCPGATVYVERNRNCLIGGMDRWREATAEDEV